jgi:hypothetical protein
MKWSDRIEALERSEKYRKDYEEYEKWRIEHGIDEIVVHDAFEQKMSIKAKALCDKYHLSYPIHPDWTLIYNTDGDIVGSMGKEMKTPAIKINLTKLGNNNSYGHVLQDDQFITVQLTIDTSKTQQQIEDEFKTLYQHWIAQGSGRKRSPRTNMTYQGKEIDHWLIFDMMKEKKNKSRVMKDLFGIVENPTYDKEARARYNQIERYYDKACRLMREFDSK